MLIDVINRIAEDTGLDPTQQRAQIVKLCNISARELYHELECNRIYREVSALVPRNKIVSLPSIVGELRGMRQHTSEVLVPLVAMSPRYASNTLGYKWKNWRDLGQSPIHTTPVSSDALTFVTNRLEDAVVTINGATNVAAREVEDVTISASPTISTKLWVNSGIKSITSFSTRTCDIQVLDADNNEVAVLYNNERGTRYKMIDVSELFWGQDTSDGTTMIDILYKEPLYIFENNSDSFPAGDIYDEAWHARAMATYYDPQPQRKDDANKFRMKSLVLLRNIKDGSEHGIIKKIEFGRNKYMTRAYYCHGDAYSDDIYAEY